MTVGGNNPSSERQSRPVSASPIIVSANTRATYSLEIRPMNKPVVDLRSDTVTKPTPAMRVAMAESEVGDDVIDQDPTIERLQSLTAELLGKEAAIYMPSGSMTNQVAVRIHCKPGDEFLCESGCHIYNYEQGAFAQLSGLVARTIDGQSGLIQASQLMGCVRADNEHLVRTTLLCLENTHNRGAGRVQPLELVEESCRWARGAGLKTHLDGARLFNAVAATGIDAATWSQHFDTVSVCFSKGLGAPVGSALAGSRAGHRRSSKTSQAVWRWHAPGRRHRGRRTLCTREPSRSTLRRSRQRATDCGRGTRTPKG